MGQCGRLSIRNGRGHLAVVGTLTLIAGLLVRVGDAVYDASVFHQLQQLREDAVQSATQAIQSSLERFAVES